MAMELLRSRGAASSVQAMLCLACMVLGTALAGQFDQWTTCGSCVVRRPPAAL